MGNDRDHPLSPVQTRDLHRLAGLMIPADDSYGVPAANDSLIFADIVTSLGRDLPDVQAALDALAAFAGASFADLDDATAQTVATTFLATQDRITATLGRVVLQCYYRDDRVLRALGHPARAPFPQGHVLEQGDWSLLDAVRHRPPLWRDDRRI